MNRSVSAADKHAAVSLAEAALLFGALSEFPVLILAVSGGPDSTALLWLAARWRKALKRGPRLLAITVDHALRPESKREAQAVAKLARRLGVAHRTLRWTGRKGTTGLQEAARAARYRLLADAARKAGAFGVVTAHTLDDQAETVLFRLARGSGVTGLAGMAFAAAPPVPEALGISLLRPLLGVPKVRLVATVKAAKLGYADDPTNRDPKFVRPRLRQLMPVLAREGLTAERLALLARRVRRLESTLSEVIDHAATVVAPGQWQPGGTVALEARTLFELPDEIALRLLGRAIGCAGDEGPVELGKLEALCAALYDARHSGRFRRTLAGAIVTLSGQRIVVERAPPRRARASKRP